MSDHKFFRHLADSNETAKLGAELALFARQGMVILLEGALGSGKSTLARAFIYALAAPKDDFDVPSPTFSLVQSYDQTRVPVTHADLYRLNSQEELQELGLEETIGFGLLVVEWPEKLKSLPTIDILRIKLCTSTHGRLAELQPNGSWVQALNRLNTIRQFLDKNDWHDFSRSFLEGDASFRRYERLHRNGETFILMDMPRRPDGPPVRDGKPYSQIAHLAEDLGAVIAVNEELRCHGLSAPATYTYDLDQGVALIEDLGDHVFGHLMKCGRDMSELMKEAVHVLARIAVQKWPASLTLSGGERHYVSPYDLSAMEIEISLLLDWFWPFLKSQQACVETRESFFNSWQPLLKNLEDGDRVWTLRDYHSPNLLWLPERSGLERVGLIDTQDCVLGHPAYDLASLLQDARIDIPFAFADMLFDHYCTLRHETGQFDQKEFTQAFAILGAQRATKILGIFARLSKRDGKHSYLAHIPRVSRYLERNLQHPALADLKGWFTRNLPADSRESRSM